MRITLAFAALWLAACGTETACDPRRPTLEIPGGTFRAESGEQQIEIDDAGGTVVVTTFLGASRTVETFRITRRTRVEVVR